MRHIILKVINLFYKIKNKFTSKQTEAIEDLDLCKNCGYPFIKVKKYHVYCCDACRSANHYKMRKAAKK